MLILFHTVRPGIRWPVEVVEEEEERDVRRDVRRFGFYPSRLRQPALYTQVP